MEKNLNTEDELFCLRFELETLSNKVNFEKSERWVKGYISESTERAHIDRYDFISKFVENSRVLDIACGAGYGSFMLIKLGKAKQVLGVDIDADAIRYGNLKYLDERIQRIVGDAVYFSNSDKFETIISFETVEHISNYADFILNLHSNLEKGGVLYISTPISRTTTTTPINPYHVIEWSFNDFHKIFAEDKFVIENIFVQDLVLQPENPIKGTYLRRRLNHFLKLPQMKKSNTTIPGIVNYNTLSIDLRMIVSGYQILELRKK